MIRCYSKVKLLFFVFSQLKFLKKFPQPFPLLTHSPCLLMMRSSGALQPKMFVLLNLPSLLTPSQCPPILLSLLLMRMSLTPVEHLPLSVTTHLAYQRVLLPVLLVTHVSSLVTPPVCPMDLPSQVYPAHPTGMCFVHVCIF